MQADALESRARTEGPQGGPCRGVSALSRHYFFICSRDCAPGAHRFCLGLNAVLGAAQHRLKSRFVTFCNNPLFQNAKLRDRIDKTGRERGRPRDVQTTFPRTGKSASSPRSIHEVLFSALGPGLTGLYVKEYATIVTNYLSTQLTRIYPASLSRIASMKHLVPVRVEYFSRWALVCD